MKVSLYMYCFRNLLLPIINDIITIKTNYLKLKKYFKRAKHIAATIIDVFAQFLWQTRTTFSRGIWLQVYLVHLKGPQALRRFSMITWLIITGRILTRSCRWSSFLMGIRRCFFSLWRSIHFSCINWMHKISCGTVIYCPMYNFYFILGLWPV